jgi:hypothetical protein
VVTPTRSHQQRFVGVSDWHIGVRSIITPLLKGMHLAPVCDSVDGMIDGVLATQRHVERQRFSLEAGLGTTYSGSGGQQPFRGTARLSRTTQPHQQHHVSAIELFLNVDLYSKINLHSFIIKYMASECKNIYQRFIFNQFLNRRIHILVHERNMFSSILLDCLDFLIRVDMI